MSLAPARIAVALVASTLLAGAACAADPAPAPMPPRALAVVPGVWQGDFDGMLARREIRVAVPYSRSLYFLDRGQEMGISADGIRGFERWLNRRYAATLGNRPLTVYIGVYTRDELLARVADGRADLAVGSLTDTPERERLVDFFAPPDGRIVNEILVTRPAGPAIRTAEDLSGHHVAVRRSASYYDSLVALNGRLAAAGRPPVTIDLVPDALEDEDLMEMTQAGLLPAIVVDDWKARMWAPALPRLVVRADVVLRARGVVGWAFRKESPKLAAEIAAYYRTVARTENLLSVSMAKYLRRAAPLRDPHAEEHDARFAQTIAIFRQFGGQYGFDPLMLAAQGFQESTLDQNKRSPQGAIGVMQLLPATGTAMQVGDIRDLEPNIHAGAKYMDALIAKYFADAAFDDQNRALFAFASYNAGPGNIARMRALAKAAGYDPDRWFNHVEVVTGQKLGMETTGYVRNIYKYYVAYRMVADAQERDAKAREGVK